ncbi:class I SAM-dependent methyltransferase [Nocardioides campestrisoli]|uniref:class I SAM-dependent methyltransferase n=1 Tax=Nocardioides campestrisoli TaxID=2736757 RepID=UPI00163D7168|nr:class I SAM-dependent methyltransferase [Nocardioides campestrisoli]
MGNPKSEAWDLIGSDYWAASYNGGPTGADITAMLEGVEGSTQVAVVGASTVHLIRAAVDRGTRVTVLDFAPGQRAAIQEAARDWSGGERCSVEHYDATEPAPPALRGRFDLVLADRLVNRFTDDEALAGVPSLLSLVAPGGRLRTTIRLGLYDRDRALIAAAEPEGRVAEFFDADAMEIDYGRAGDLLDRALPRHGDIPRATILDFYRLRGPEKRMTVQDVERYVAASRASVKARIVAADPLPLTSVDTLFDIEVE